MEAIEGLETVLVTRQDGLWSQLTPPVTVRAAVEDVRAEKVHVGPAIHHIGRPVFLESVGSRGNRRKKPFVYLLNMFLSSCFSAI